MGEGVEIIDAACTHLRGVGGEVCDKKSEVWTVSKRKRKRLWSKLFVGHYNCSFSLNWNSPKRTTTCTSHLIIFWPILIPIALFASLSAAGLGNSILVFWSRRQREAKRTIYVDENVLATILLFSVDQDTLEFYNAQCDDKIWRRIKIHGGRTIKTEKYSFFLNRN